VRPEYADRTMANTKIGLAWVVDASTGGMSDAAPHGCRVESQSCLTLRETVRGAGRPLSDVSDKRPAESRSPPERITSTQTERAPS
jgi:hypothetical protein